MANVLSTLLEPVVKPLVDLASEFITDKDKALEFKSKAYELVLTNEGKLIEASSAIIQAEAKSESWLTRNWRPLTMLSFLGLLWSYWLGYSPENLDPATLGNIFDLLKIGLGGYVVGRSGEKVVKEWKKK